MRRCCIIPATEIATKKGITTITVADGALQNLCANQEVAIQVSTSFEITELCARVVVTDGTSTLLIACRNQYWRPKSLICNSVIFTEYKTDPELLVFKFGRC